MSDAARFVVSRKPRLFLKVFIYLAGVVVGGYFGGLAFFIGYDVHDVEIHVDLLIGCALGAGGGLLAGWLWCYLLLDRLFRQPQGRPTFFSLLILGPLAGLLVGLVATLILWVGLSVLSFIQYLSLDDAVRNFLKIIPIGLTFGAAAGVATGLGCGIVATVVMLATCHPEAE